MINNIINIEMNNGINVKVDRGTIIGVSSYELQEHLEDLFKIKKTYKSKEVIKLSSLCDVMFDLIFCGRSKTTKEIYFKLC
jgi:hypothetical protein